MNLVLYVLSVYMQISYTVCNTRTERDPTLCYFGEQVAINGTFVMDPAKYKQKPCRFGCTLNFYHPTLLTFGCNLEYYDLYYGCHNSSHLTSNNQNRVTTFCHCDYNYCNALNNTAMLNHNWIPTFPCVMTKWGRNETCMTISACKTLINKDRPKSVMRDCAHKDVLKMGLPKYNEMPYVTPDSVSYCYGRQCHRFCFTPNCNA